MFYAYTHTILTTNTAAAPKRIDMELAAGVIHQVDILFEDGCNHKAAVQVWRGGHQLWPANRGAYLTGNATVVSFREFEELTKGKNDLYALVWGDGVIENVQTIIQIGILPKAILQPMSFEELLAAAQMVE